MPREEREKRMQIYQDFVRAVDVVRSGSSDGISEADLSNAKDLRVVMTGLASPTDSQAVTIHFGSNDFAGKFRMLVENFAQWQANAGHIQSIDLQYARQVVVNSDSSVASAKLKK
jgi:cell division protein FtsQ